MLVTIHLMRLGLVDAIAALVTALARSLAG